MAEDLLKSLAELDEMLKEMPKEGLISPHEGSDGEDSENAKKFCIGNGSYVRIDDDGMTAWLYLNPPAEGEDFYSRDLIVQFITENEVTQGFHNSNISAIAKKHVYEREIVVAKGADPFEGENGYYEFFFDTTDKRKPRIREDGTVDYSAMSNLTNVNEGDLVARYHPAVTGRDGYDVKGRCIQAKAARDIPALKGRGISNDIDVNEYYATTSGRIDYRDGHIDIKNVYEIKGDVDLVTGKVEFFGDIHIQGNVGTGVLVRASRNVIIDGMVEAATIYAGGDVVISKGIQGAQKGRITAKGNVSAEFIEFATIEAGENVRSNSYINANVYAAGMVLAEGKNGIILGGSVRGLLGVSAICIGNEAEIKTLVASGYSAEDYMHYLDVYKKENEIKKQLSDTVEQMTEILKKKRVGVDVGEAAEKLLVSLNEKKDEYFEELDKIKAEIEMLTSIIEKGKGSVILANDKIFRGVTICVEGNLMQVPENTCFMRYKNEGGKIVPSVIVRN